MLDHQLTYAKSNFSRYKKPGNPIPIFYIFCEHARADSSLEHEG